jgi:arsenate reductase (thioredoxin)
MENPKVLFLCTHNAARSQMAEAFLKKLAGDRFQVFSAGCEVKEIAPPTQKEMAEAGLDLAEQRSKSLKEFMGKMTGDYLIIVCQKTEENCPITFPGFGRRLYWPFEEPLSSAGSEDAQLAKFREVRDQIEARLKLWLRESELD